MRNILLLGVFVLISAFPTFSLDYEEHQLVSKVAINLAVESGGLIVDQKVLHNGLNSKYLCENLIEPLPKGCLTLSDFPAIAGDHAASPLLTKWKWLNEQGIDSKVIRLFDYIAITKAITQSSCTSSETTRSRIPKVVKFSKLVHEYQVNGKLAKDDELAKFDQNYIRSAGHNCNHFRKPNSQSSDDWFNESSQVYASTISKRTGLRFWVDKNERIRLKPKLVASAWYAQLHASALELASSKYESDIAAAWLFETFALHFLQDGSTAGHILAPTEGGSGPKTKSIHDKYSKEGLLVSIAAACNYLNNEHETQVVALPLLVNSCAGEQNIVRIYGDESLDKSPITKELAAFLSYVSLLEFGEALRLKTPLMQPPVLEEPLTNDPHWTYDWSTGADRELYKAMFRWWESAGQETVSNSPMQEATLLHINHGNMKALTLWPKLDDATN